MNKVSLSYVRVECGPKLLTAVAERGGLAEQNVLLYVPFLEMHDLVTEPVRLPYR